MSLQQPPGTRRNTASNGLAGGNTVALLARRRAAVIDLFERYETLVETDGAEDEKQALAARIRAMLATHATVDEGVFPLAVGTTLDKGDGRDAKGNGRDASGNVVQATAKDLIDQLRSMEPDEARSVR